MCPFNAAENADETHARAAVAAVPDDLRVDAQRERRVGMAHLVHDVNRVSGAFVGDVVQNFAFPPAGSGRKPIHVYSIWNEPNYPARTGPPDQPGKSAFWLRVKCGSGSNAGFVANTAPIYRELYDQGFASVRAKDSSARVLLGEFTSRTEHGWSSCTDHTREKLGTFNYLALVAGAGTPPLLTNGVAWHPYQHYVRPTSDKDAREVGIGKIRSCSDRAHNGQPFARLGMQGEIDYLHDAGLLQTPKSGDRPWLYLTEFGYYNEPTKANAVGSVHDEATRADRYYDAIRRARSTPHTRTFIVYESMERGKSECRGNPAPLGTFDTGVLGYNCASGQPDGRNALVNGTIPYGPNKNQAREAYCKI